MAIKKIILPTGEEVDLAAGGGIDVSYDEENKAVVFTGSSGGSGSGGNESSEALYPLPLVAELTLTEEVSTIEFTVDQFPLMKGLKSILYIDGEINPSEDTKANNTGWLIGVASESVTNYCFTSNKHMSPTKTTYYQCTIERVAENRTNAMTVSKDLKYVNHAKLGPDLNAVMFDNWHGQRSSPINFEHIVFGTHNNASLFGVGTTIRIYGR